MSDGIKLTLTPFEDDKDAQAAQATAVAQEAEEAAVEERFRKTPRTCKTSPKKNRR